MNGSAAMVQELQATKQVLADRYAASLRETASKLSTLREDTAETEAERDRLVRESAPVLLRAQAAEHAGISLSRIDQIIGGGG